jgi:hypothetical protein
MRSCIRAALILCAVGLGVPAAAQNYVVKDAAGATQTMASKLNGGVNFPEHVVTDPTGAHALIVTAGGAAMVDGSAVTQPVSGAVSLTGALPVFAAEPTVKLDQTGANNGVQVENSVAVTGTFWPATQPVSGTFWQATQPVSGTFWQATQPVSGTFWQATQPISGSLTANAGTNLNTSALALESGGNLASTATNTAGAATDLGAPGASACSTDTGSCSLNALLQRIAQRLSTSITTLNAPMQASGGTVGVVAGSAVIGKVGIDQTTPGTTNGTQDAADGSTGAGVPSKATYAGAVSSGNLTGLVQADHSTPINVSTATTTQLVALSSGKAIYITHWDVVVAGADNVTLEYGTGSNCGTGTTALTGAYNLPANGGVSAGVGLSPVIIVPAGDALCILTSAAAQASGVVSYTQF